MSASFSTIAAENAAVTQGTGTTCWTVPSNLNPGVLYYWRVRATNGTAMSAWSATRRFMTPNSVPTVPALSSPANGATVTILQPALAITNSTDSDGTTPTYHFQLSTTSAFTTIAVENTSVPQGTGGTTWTVTPALANLTTYYWRVRAYDGIAYSGWSASRSLYVNQPASNQPPSVPVLSSPANAATLTTLQPALTTNNSADPEGVTPTYHFQVSTSSAFTTITVENTSVVQGVGTTTTWNVTPALANLTTYYWRVRAFDGQAYSNWSSSRSFYVNQPGANQPPSVPILSLPANGTIVNSMQPSLTTNNSTDPEGATPSYHFQLSTSSTFSSIAVENLSVAQGVGGTTVWQVTPALTNLTTYYWRVRAYDGTAYSGWSAYRSIYVNQTITNSPPSIPLVDNPLNNAKVSNMTPDLTVNNSADTNGDPLTYQFELYNGTFSTLLAQSPMITEGAGGHTSWRVPFNLSVKTYYTWRARAYDSKAYSNWMSRASFRTNRPPLTPAPRTPLPNDTISGSFVVLVTNNTTDPDNDMLTYDFVVFSDSLLTKVVGAARDVPQGASYTLYTSTATYANNQPYWWRVRAFDGGDWCNWSDPLKFTHFESLLDVLESPIAIDPPRLSTQYDLQPALTIAWSGSGTSNCQFELATDSGFVTIIDGGTVVGENGTATWTPTRPLENGVTYHWRAKREGGGYSAGSSFTVSAPVFVSPNPFSYLDGQITIHNLPPDARFEVFTSSGDRVIEIRNIEGDYNWNGLNENGEKLGSGVYLYYVRFSDKTYSDKFIVVR